MRILQVQFISGREVLGHYWGLLSGGGLAIRLPKLKAPNHEDSTGEPFLPGEDLCLHIQVLSIKKTYEVPVKVLEIRPGEGEPSQLIVTFLPGTAAEDLLDASWADGCDAPQRRSRRLPLSTQVHYERLDGREMESRVGRLVNLSQGGCCVEGSLLPPPGTQVLLTTLPKTPQEGSQVKLLGRVRWTERAEGGYMGIEFLGATPDVGPLLLALGSSESNK